MFRAGGEGASIPPIDAHGRQLYLPPNSAANANYLQPLRYMLLQDYDLDYWQVGGWQYFPVMDAAFAGVRRVPTPWTCTGFAFVIWHMTST